jgi:putative DNA primase/helicase
MVNHRCEEPKPLKSIRQIADSMENYSPDTRYNKLETNDPGLRLFPYTDSGNAERIAQKFAGTVRYCAPQHCWDTWTGKRWEPDQTGAMLQRTKLIARELYEEAGRIEDAEQRKTCAEWARKCESADRRRAALFLAQSEPGIPVLPAEFDRDAFALNCLNGTVNLKTGELREHRPEDLITRLAPVQFDSAARSELWEQFLEQSTGGDKELKCFLQRAAGYSLTGSICEEVLFFVHGPAASGKSTFLETLKASFGDYAKVADFESFIARRDVGAIRNDIAELAGRRFVLSIEVDEGKKLAEGLVKLLTGGDTVRARFLYQEAFEFAPSFKLWLAANHAPRVRDNDTAIWRRILRLPFEHVVPKARRDPTVKARLKDPAVSGPAILAWAVEGCLRWQQEGLRVPEVVEQATEQYRLDMDPLKLFFDERCTFFADAWTSAKTLRDTYETWAKDSGERALDARQFAERLRERGCIQKPTRAGRGWSGIALMEDR